MKKKYDYKIIFNEYEDLRGPHRRLMLNFLFTIFNDCNMGYITHIMGDDYSIIFFNEDKIDFVKKLIRIYRLDNFIIQENND